MLVSISPVYREEVLAWHLKDARLRHCHVYLRLFARASVSKGNSGKNHQLKAIVSPRGYVTITAEGW